jgi:hypothetical protein
VLREWQLTRIKIQHGFLFYVDAHRDGKRSIVKADDLLTAFLSQERDALAPKGADGNATRDGKPYVAESDNL